MLVLCLRCVLVLVLWLLVACDEPDSPAELDHAQLLAVSAAPACLEPGDAAALDVLVAGPDGTIQPRRVSWSLSSGNGRVEGATYVAPAAAPGPDGASAATLRAEAHLADGLVLLGEKRVHLAGPAACADRATSSVVELRVDGRPVAGALQVAAGSVVALSVTVEPEPDDWSDALVTWHGTCGEFDDYRAPLAQVSVGDDACDGFVYAVFRDAYGGIAWLERSFQVGAP